MTSSALHGDEDGRRIDEDRRHGDEVSGPSKIASRFLIKNGFFSEPSPCVPFRNSKLVLPLHESQIFPSEFAALKALDSEACAFSSPRDAWIP